MCRPKSFVCKWLGSFVLAWFLALFAPLVAVRGLLENASAQTADFHYRFAVDGVLNESGSSAEASSPYFWLNSGGRLILDDHVGQTQQGPLPANNPWRLLYNQNNPLDTDNGYFPQNLFRLITKSTWGNVAEQVRFNIRRMNLTDTPNRDGYSGILLMSRYQSGQTLYYAGLRQDGKSVIKKKVNGTYHTLAMDEVWPGSYHRLTNPNLIPERQWMGLKMTTDNVPGGVKVSLYLDENDNGQWERLLEVTDTNGTGGLSAITGSGSAGIRTDYMDVIFDNYKLRNL